jgi:hypothetical protein
LLLISANNLGFHLIFGFLESFSATKFCRFSEVAKTDEYKFLESHFEMFTAKSLDDNVALLKSTHYNSSLTGIKAECILNEVPTFHVATNYIVVTMHDILEGIVPYELQLILPQLIKENVDEQELKSLIINFSCNPLDQNSKPLLYVQAT